MTRYLFSLQHNSTVSCLYFCLAPLLVPEVDLLNQMRASPRRLYSVVALGLRFACSISVRSTLGTTYFAKVTMEILKF